MKRFLFIAFLISLPPALLLADEIPDWVVYPQEKWIRITPAQAGFDVEKMNAILAEAEIRGTTWGGVKAEPNDWGAVITRGGYLVYTWGDPNYKCQSASLGKNFTWALVGLAVQEGLIDVNEPIWKSWTGEGLLSHPHKYLNRGYHKTLTWRNVLEHKSGFILESGFHWRTRLGFHRNIPKKVKYTGDPLYDNYAHWEPGTVKRYSSGAFWRLGQALTAVWDDDLKKVIDEKLLCHIGIKPDDWEWLPGKVVHDTNDFYPQYSGYGEYIGPPYEINGHIVRGGPGWVIMSPMDLSRFGQLIATGGIWNGKRLISKKYLPNLQYGVYIHAFAGDPETMVSYAKLNTKNFPFGGGGDFSFPKELITGPVDLARQRAERKPAASSSRESCVKIDITPKEPQSNRESQK